MFGGVYNNAWPTYTSYFQQYMPQPTLIDIIIRTVPTHIFEQSKVQDNE